MNYLKIILFLIFLVLICKCDEEKPKKDKSKLKNLKCHRPLDVVLALDASGRTSMKEWETAVKFCKELVRNLEPISDRENRIGILSFNEKPRIVKDLNKRTSPEEVHRFVNALLHTKRGGMTFTDEALREVLKVFAREDDVRDSHKVLILFYDGRTTDRLGKKGIILNRDPISKLRKEDVQIFVVEFGAFLGEEDILNVVSEPKLEHIYTLNDLPELSAAVRNTAWKVCAKI